MEPYADGFLDALQFVWGKGFLSPGGAEEVASILSGYDISGWRVLDIGSGLGGVDLILVERHDAGEVIGIDVDDRLVASATQLASSKGMSNRVKFELTRPGPLSFDDSSFDLVFSKDAMVLIHDKLSLFREVIRVLKPGAVFLAADWLWAKGAETSAPVQAWLSNTPIDYAFTTPLEARNAMEAAGFADVSVIERTHIMQASNRKEIELLEGPALRRLAELVGEDGAASRLRSARRRQVVLDSGNLIPSHIKGKKPVLQPQEALR